MKDSTTYPATFLITGDGDTRVDPMHARKMAARLQHASGSRTPILLRHNTLSGSSGGQPKRKIIDELVDICSFLSWNVGLEFDVH